MPYGCIVAPSVKSVQRRPPFPLRPWAARRSATMIERPSKFLPPLVREGVPIGHEIWRSDGPRARRTGRAWRPGGVRRPGQHPRGPAVRDRPAHPPRNGPIGGCSAAGAGDGLARPAPSPRTGPVRTVAASHPRPMLLHRSSSAARLGCTRQVLPLDGPGIPDESGALANRDQVDRGFRRLTPEQRAMLVLRHYLGLPADEIADTLGVPAGTVRSDCTMRTGRCVRPWKLTRAPQRYREGVRHDQPIRHRARARRLPRRRGGTTARPGARRRPGPNRSHPTAARRARAVEVPAMSTRLKPLLAAVAVIAVIVVGASFLTGRLAGVPTPTPTWTPEPTVSAWDLPALTLPGARGGAPGEYGWTGYSGAGAGMHWVTESGEVAAMRFANRISCFRGADVVTVPVTVAGYDAVYVEPYEPPVTFIRGMGDETTRAYGLKIGSGICRLRDLACNHDRRRTGCRSRHPRHDPG